MYIRRYAVKHNRSKFEDIWPINKSVIDKKLDNALWPEGKDFAFILRHDVETERGVERCRSLAEIDMNHGFKASFNFVPHRYETDSLLRQHLIEIGFEIGVHGLTHDGKLYSSKKIFKDRAIIINKFIEQWNAFGFYSPAAHHNLDWLHDLNIEYDSSTFDTDPFEPQPDPVNTIFPFVVMKHPDVPDSYVEIPYTLPQDFTIYILMEEKTNEIWKRKLDWIAENGGVAFLNTHPDYMYFHQGRKKITEYPVELYSEFLQYVSAKYKNRYWHVIPRELARFWSRYSDIEYGLHYTQFHD